MSDITIRSFYLSTKFISSFTFIYFKNLNLEIFVELHQAIIT